MPKRKRGTQEPDRYPAEPERETKPKIVPPSPPKPREKAPRGRSELDLESVNTFNCT
jgi:hypothetical protein